MTATITFCIQQTTLNFWEIYTLAQILNVKARLDRDSDWVLRIELDEELRWIEDDVAVDSAAWAHWQEVIRPDVQHHLGRELADLIEECLEIEVVSSEVDYGNAEHMADYQRAAFKR